jgi:subtilisin family serine protease
MLQKHKLTLTLPIFVIIGFVLLSPNNSEVKPTAQNEQTNQLQALTTETQKSDSNNQIQDTQSTPNARQSSQTKNQHYTSPTLKSSPNYQQVPYYLLATVNDPLFGTSWHHSKIQTDRGWDLSTGSSSATVAVIDTGFELNHEDLSSKWYQNNGEIGQTNGDDFCWTGSPIEKSTNNCDDDQNGYVDDWRGFDFFYADNNPQAGQVNPTGEGTTHGSLVSGTIGAVANNNKGSAGIDQNVKILPLQVFSDDGEAFTDDLVSAIDYATDMNVNVINLSLGSDQYDATLLSAINRARTNGTLVVAASGNCALNDKPICNNLSAPGRMTYPALYDNVIAVGATNSTDQRASFSSYGSQLDVVAPGNSIGPLPIYNNGAVNSYAIASGTSFASPLVAGLASVLIAQNPNASLSQLEEILIKSTDKISAMNGQTFTNEFGNGRINAHKATLLGLAKTQENLLGNNLTSPRQPAVGKIWRSVTGNVGHNEVILVGCRIFDADICSVTAENNGIYRFNPGTLQKNDVIQYIFINGSSLPNGSSSISVHNHEYATQVSTLIK